MSGKTMTRQLSVADNLDVMGRLAAGSVQLVYLDPPFNSGRTYETVLPTRNRQAGRVGRATFEDRWTWDGLASDALRNMSDSVPGPTKELIRSLVKSLGHTDLSAYLVMILPRLQELHRVLAETGSLYLHCDPAASHYLKLILDQIFGADNFRNEIIWKRTHAHSSSRRYGPVHDVILFYTRGREYVWNPVYTAYRPEYIRDHYRNEDAKGRYQLITCTAPGDRAGTRSHYSWKGLWPPPGRHWAWTKDQMLRFEADGRLEHSSNGVPRLKRYVWEGHGVAVQDVWTDVARLDAHSEERIGFETQKPLRLVERLILASSNEGDLVLDPFAGSGTTLVAAEGLDRSWIGIDSSLLASCLALGRVRPHVGVRDVVTTGFPASVREAVDLQSADPVGFGVWASSMLATLADRQDLEGGLMRGQGRIESNGRRLDLFSWIPMRRRYSAELPEWSTDDSTRLAFWLNVGSSFDRLGEWLDARAAFRSVTMVRIEDLVARTALKRGIASVIAKFAKAA